MKVQCPKCGFSGNVADELIPDQGRFVGCPKCHERFLIQKPITESFEILETPDEVIPASESVRPIPTPVIGPSEPIPKSTISTEPQEVPPPTSQPRRAFWNSSGFLAWAAIVIFVIIVWAAVSPNSARTPTKTNDTIKTVPPSEVPVQPDVTVPNEPDVLAPESVPTEEESTDGLKPSYYDEDGTPVFDNNVPNSSNDSTSGTTGYSVKEPPANSDDGSDTVYITRTGECYHRDGCSYLKSRIPVSRSEAIARGLRPCSRCSP